MSFRELASKEDAKLFIGALCLMPYALIPNPMIYANTPTFNTNILLQTASMEPSNVCEI
jgi:hypothetical protein